MSTNILPQRFCEAFRLPNVWAAVAHGATLQGGRALRTDSLFLPIFEAALWGFVLLATCEAVGAWAIRSKRLAVPQRARDCLLLRTSTTLAPGEVLGG